MTLPMRQIAVPAELGRVASHYYIRHNSILVFNEHLKPHMGEADVLSMIAQSSGASARLLIACCAVALSRPLPLLSEVHAGGWAGKPHHAAAQLAPAALTAAAEFENLAVREEELPELDTLDRESCPYEVKGGCETKQGKANVLLQARFGWCGRGRGVCWGSRKDARNVAPS